MGRCCWCSVQSFGILVVMKHRLSGVSDHAKREGQVAWRVSCWLLTRVLSCWRVTSLNHFLSEAREGSVGFLAWGFEP